MRPTSSRLIFQSLLGIAILGSAFRLTDDFHDQLIDRFQAYSQQRPTEKVYVHTDRDAYLAGETIWLKGYLMNGITHDVDTVSRVLYVDLVNPLTRRVQVRAQLRASAGYAPGQFTLPDSLGVGTYQLRGYTNYMRNEPEAYFFSKSITVLQATASSTSTPINSVSSASSGGTSQTRPDVQFLPEGGQLIEGIESRIAFKAVNAFGRSLSVKGFILNSKKDTVIGLTSTYLGMGSFTFKPEKDLTYTAYIKGSDDALEAYPIPLAKPQGAIIQVDNMSSKKYVKVYIRHNKPITDTSARFTLMAQTRGQLVQVARIPLSKKLSVVQLQKAEFPEGIAHLTLFDETHKPVSERLIFIQKEEQIKVTVATDKKTYKNREQVTVAITTTDAQGKPVAANLSLAAIDAQMLPQADSNRATLVSHLLLSSDLTGYIEQPNHYFEPAHLDRWQQLDLLLMTQGWRRFTWDDVLAGTIPAINYPIERGLSLTGRVSRPNQKEIGEKVRLTFLLAQRDSTRSFIMGETDATGNFAAYDLDFSDTTTVFIQGVKRAANHNLCISLDQLLTPMVTLTQIPYNPIVFQRDELHQFMIRANESLALERRLRNNGALTLQTVTVKAKKYQERDSRVIYSNPRASIKLDPINTAGARTVLDIIQGKVAGVSVSGSGQSARVQIRGAANFQGPISPLFLIDGMPVDLQSILTVSVQDVERIDVLTGVEATIYGSQAAGGVISVLTKRGNPNYDFTKDVSPGTLLAKLPGYAPIREFYSPRYDTPKTDNATDSGVDYRSTLYWAPMIQTNADGKASITFFTSDAKTNIHLQAEGVTLNGQPGVGRETVYVK